MLNRNLYNLIKNQNKLIHNQLLTKYLAII